MNEQELTEQFTRVDERDTGIEIQVRQISWAGPHEPTSAWKLVAQLAPGAKQMEIDKELHAILNNKKYFGICVECGAKKPAGWMSFMGNICDACAEANHGVVF